MSNEIVKHEFNDLVRMSKAFAESGMFQDCKQAAQALVKIQAGQELGVAPFASMSGIHIITGKPVLGAGLIASRIKASNKYDYKVMQHDDKACTIKFFQGKDEIGTSSFTIEDARKAGTKNLDKFPRNMLFARAISNGAKWFTPDVFSGPIYTPEDFDTDIPSQITDTQAEVLSSTTPDDQNSGSGSIKAEVIPQTDANKAQSAPETPDQPEKKSDPVPGAWLAKSEKWNSTADVLEAYKKSKETVDANKNIFEFVLRFAMSHAKSRDDVKNAYMEMKSKVDSSQEYKATITEKRDSFN